MVSKGGDCVKLVKLVEQRGLLWRQSSRNCESHEWMSRNSTELPWSEQEELLKQQHSRDNNSHFTAVRSTTICVTFCLRAIRDESAATTWCSQNCDSQLDWWFDCWPPLAKWFIWFYFIWKQKLIAAAAVAEILHNWWRLTPRLLSIETSVSVYSGTETSPEGRHWVNTFRSKKVFWNGKKWLIDLLGCRQELGRVGVFKTSLKSFWSVQLNFAISPKPFYLQTSVIAACETS